MRYSLAKYILSVEPNDQNMKSNFGVISIGGEGTYLGSINISREGTMWTTTGFATGAWIHNKSLDKHGTVNVQLNQLSNQVSKFIKLADTYFGGDYEGLTLSLSDTEGRKIASCIDCYITKVPEQAFGNEADSQTWTFTCGQINFN